MQMQSSKLSLDGTAWPVVKQKQTSAVNANKKKGGIIQ